MCREENIHFIYGLPSTAHKLDFSEANKIYFGEGKEILDICFVSAKYSEKGLDKGYDLFIEAAKLLNARHQNIHFHIIGGFSEKDYDTDSLVNSIHFYGYVNSTELTALLKKFDIIVSPNKPFILSPGAFDGFPLGSCVEASLVGCVIIATDELLQNDFYEKDIEIIIIKPEVEDILCEVEWLKKNPILLKKIGLAGLKKTQDLYSYDKQINQRKYLLDYLIKKN